jgi:hypothetical protein
VPRCLRNGNEASPAGFESVPPHPLASMGPRVASEGLVVGWRVESGEEATGSYFCFAASLCFLVRSSLY